MGYSSICYADIWLSVRVYISVADISLSVMRTVADIPTSVYVCIQVSVMRI